MQELANSEAGERQRIGLGAHPIAQQTVAIGSERTCRQDGRFKANTLEIGRRDNGLRWIAWWLLQHLGLWRFHGQGQARRHVREQVDPQQLHGVQRLPKAST